MTTEEQKMHKVIDLYTGRTSKSARIVYKPMVRLLQDLLEKAQAGEIQGVAIAFEYADGVTEFAVSVRKSSFGLIGALETAKHSIFSHDND